MNRILIISFSFFTIIGFCQSSPVVINELCARNDGQVADSYGEYDDWIELYNTSSSDFTLDGYFLSDDTLEKEKWVFPVGTVIKANDYLVVWADKDSLQDGLHASFKLSSDGEEVCLSDTAGKILDSLSFPMQFADLSTGRYPNGTGSFITMNPSFLSMNTNEEIVKQPVEDLSNTFFEPNNVYTVEITMDPADWEFVRGQSRESGHSACPEEPFESPFIYKNANVKINGELIENVGVRQKGFMGSRHSEKPSLKIKLNEFIKGQEIFDLSTLTLNNLKADKSCAKEQLIYYVYREAGVVAPRSNYAHVTMNGETLGLYTNIESIKKDFLQRNFFDNSGKMYEGIITDLIVDQQYAFEGKTDEADENRTELKDLITALNLPEERLLSVVSEMLDIDQYIRYWAAEILVGQRDGYNFNGNNFFMYFDPYDQKMEFIPWGVDLSMRRSYKPIIDFTKSKLPHKLYAYPEIRQKLAAELNRLLTSVWDEQYLSTRVNQLKVLLTPYLESDIVRSEIDTEEIMTFIEERRGHVEAFLASMPTSSVAMKACDNYTGGNECYFSETSEQNGVNFYCENGYWIQDPTASVDLGVLMNTNKVRVFPNPAQNQITIQAPNSHYTIFSLMGDKKMEGDIISNDQVIDISMLEANVYILRVGEEVIKLVKIK